jgi:protocatechuate 3,4-dioxygenase beta subunit
MMKVKFLSAIWIVTALLASCVQVEDPADSLPTGTAVQELANGPFPTAVLPTGTPLPEPTGTAAVEEAALAPAETSVAPTAELLPGLTEIPCTGLLTSPNQEGPYYSAGSPERSSLIEAGMPGTPILIFGRVFDQNCNPIPGARVDFWQADANGVYDNSGYTLRGHTFTDGNGYYEMESIAPGLYTGRPPHIHVKVFAPDGRELLTTQMYFPGSEGSQDVLVAPDLLVSYLGLDEMGRQQVLFNFVVQFG